MMKKTDYRTEFEEQRQEVDINNGEIPSRVDLHRKGRKLKERTRPRLINVLLGLFTLIPVGILIFVIFSWNSPEEKPVEGAEDSQFQFETSGKSLDKSGVVPEDEDEKNKEEIAKEEAAKKEQEEQAKKAEEEEAAAAKKAQEEQARKDEEEKVRKAQEEQARKAEEEAARKAQEEQAKKNQEEEKSTSRIHTVAAGETLYRISVNYYKSGDGVSKIMQANGLSTNEISTGQKLVIP